MIVVTSPCVHSPNSRHPDALPFSCISTDYMVSLGLWGLPSNFHCHLPIAVACVPWGTSTSQCLFTVCLDLLLPVSSITCCLSLHTTVADAVFLVDMGMRQPSHGWHCRESCWGKAAVRSEGEFTQGLLCYKAGEVNWRSQHCRSGEGWQ